MSVRTFLLGLLWVAWLAPPGPALAEESRVVRGVLFFSPTCPHCHYVMEEVLPPLVEQYGDQLQILPVDVTQSQGIQLYQSAVAALAIPQDRIGVPTLVIGDTVLVGSQEISEQLPGLIEMRLAAGGVDYWPAIPGLQAVAPSPSPATPPPASGFELAVAILIGMAAAMVYTGVMAVRAWRGVKLPDLPPRLEEAIPLLALVGLGVAGYLAYVETQAAPAVCGPVGDCNAVQSSPYARLFGAPLGGLGMMGYGAILATWFYGRLRSDRAAALAPLALFGLAVFGAVFSLYLTYLEPFVIGAVCAWCLASAVIMTALMLISLYPAARAWESS